VPAGVTFPYVPGLLSFREVPALLDAISQLRTFPHVFMVDGQGAGRPRRFGLAPDLGRWLDRLRHESGSSARGDVGRGRRCRSRA
jgi:deoxyinosine 3'endonuclease (endonuclease V)